MPRSCASSLLLWLSVALLWQMPEALEAQLACTRIEWRRRDCPVSPAGRDSHAMAYDVGRRAAILFGGRDTNSVALDDTWQYDGRGWIHLSPAHRPSPRYGHAMTYDKARGVIVLFGGRIDNTVLSDCWEWNGTDWNLVTIDSPQPPARFGHGMAYDSARKVHVLFGGLGVQEYADTWEYDGQSRTWTRRTAVGPSSRWGIQLAYDEALSYTMLFGGFTSAGATLPERYLNDTWLWDGRSGTWNRQTPATIPPGLRGYSMVYEPSRGVVRMQNGELAFSTNQTATIGASWEWNGIDWTHVESLSFFAPRYNAAMVYEADRALMLMFGGRGAYPDGTFRLERVWAADRSITIDPRWGGGQFPGYYSTVREGLNAVSGCCVMWVRGGIYPETAGGHVPLRFTQPLQILTASGEVAQIR